MASSIAPEKDVDGANPESMGRLMTGMPAFAPATAQAVVEILRSAQVPLAGANVVIVGRSIVVGKPAAMLLLAEDATVTICHSRSRELPSICRRADVLVAAVGRPGFVTADYIGPDAIVIDVGTNPTVDGGLVGDVDRVSVEQNAAALTPVPGGVGTVTTALLLSHGSSGGHTTLGAPLSSKKSESVCVNFSFLGGSRFVGRHIVAAALHRGWHVTILNNENRLNHAPPGVTALYANRMDVSDMTAALRNERWDAVVDTWQGAPLAAQLSAGLLRKIEAWYCLISSVTVYASSVRPPISEHSACQSSETVTPDSYRCTQTRSRKSGFGSIPAALADPPTGTNRRSMGVRGPSSMVVTKDAGRRPCPRTGTPRQIFAVGRLARSRIICNRLPIGKRWRRGKRRRSHQPVNHGKPIGDVPADNRAPVRKFIGPTAFGCKS